MAAARANPYPGLRAFQADETHLFFGRDEQRIDLLHRLRRSRFLAIVGTSGSGKSSLVRAGLLPGLHGGFMAGQTNRWRIADLRPGTDPIGNLARALDTPGALRDVAPADDEPTFTEATLRRSGLGLVEAVREARLPDTEKVLVLVDQFEELFRASETTDRVQSSDDASAFVKLLLEAAQQHELPIYVVLTMRSDFLGECSRFRDLPEAINDGQYLVPRLSRDQRAEAIIGPAAVHGVVLSSTLINRLLNDVGDNPDQLPILQHALMRTWDHWQRRVSAGAESHEIGLADYEAIGGMASALSQHADAVLEGLAQNESPQDAARRTSVAETLFKCLAGTGAGGVAVRRLASVQEIVDVAGVPVADVCAVIEAFRAPGQSFLMPPAGEPLTPDRYIDISHESLLRNWVRMKTWIGEEAESARVYERLSSTATLHAKGEAGLWDQPDLGVALQWRSTRKPTGAWARRYNTTFEQAMAFLDASRSRAQAAENARARRRGIWALGTVLVFAATLTAILTSVLGDLVRAHELSSKAGYASAMLEDLAGIVKLHRASVAGAVEAEGGRLCVRYANREGYRSGLWSKLCAPNATLEADEQAAIAIYEQLLDGRWRDASEATSKRRFEDGTRLLTLLGATRWPTDPSERRLLLDLRGQGMRTAPSPEQQAGIARLVHPVHRRLARILTGQLPDGLTAEETLLLEAYEAADALRFGGGSPPSTTASWSSKPSRDTQRERGQRIVEQLYDLPEGRVYGDVVLGALTPEWQLVESFETSKDMLSKSYSSTDTNLVWPLLITWPVWRLWRLVQQRRGKPAAARPHPLRCASAALFDVGLAVIVVAIVDGVAESAARICFLAWKLPDPFGSVPDTIGFWAGFIAGVGYLVCRDAIRFRFRRSFGKALFHLRPLVTSAAATPARTVRALIARNTIWLVVAFATYGSGIQFLGDYYYPGLSAAWVLAPLGLLTMGIVLLVDVARSWFKKRETLLNRWSKTTVVDADAAEALAIRP